MSGLVSPRVGDRVQLSGLQKRPDLNGRFGCVVQSINNEGRISVQLIGAASARIEELSIKCENLVIFSSTADCCFTPTVPVLKTDCSLSPASRFTPPKLLIENLPAHRKKCQILLLGCEDFHSILYTCSAMWKEGGLASEHALDVTTCSQDFPRLAKSILVMKLILETDCEALRMVWVIIFSSHIDEHSLLLLESCAVQLLVSATDLVSWHQTDFGRMFRFADEDTFDGVVAIWRVYAEGRISKSKEAASDKAKRDMMYEAGQKASRPSLPSREMLAANISPFLSSAGSHPFTITTATAPDDGLPPACVYHPTNRGQSWSLNPTLLQGSRRRRVRAGEDEKLPAAKDGTEKEEEGLDEKQEEVEKDEEVYYHCYNDHAAVHPFHSFPIAYAYMTSDTPSEDDFYRCCFQEFSEWCFGFKSQFSRGLVTVRVYCGDAMSLCEYLARSRRSSRSSDDDEDQLRRLAPNYSLKPMELLDDTPTSFDVVDSSYSVTDANGLLNVLLVASPLLKPGLHSVLNTDMATINESDHKWSSMAVLIERLLFGDMMTMCSIIGLTTYCSNHIFTNLDYRLHLWQKQRRHTGTADHHSLATKKGEKEGEKKGGKEGEKKGGKGVVKEGEKEEEQEHGQFCCSRLKWYLVPELCEYYTISGEDFVELFQRIYKNMFKTGEINCSDNKNDTLSASKLPLAVMRKDKAAIYGRPSILTYALLVRRFLTKCCHSITPRDVGKLLTAIQRSGFVSQRLVDMDISYTFERLGLICSSGPTEKLPAKLFADLLSGYGKEVILSTAEKLGLLVDLCTASPLVKLTLLIPREEFDKEEEMLRYNPNYHVTVKNPAFPQPCFRFHSIHQSYVRACIHRSDPDYGTLPADCAMQHYPHVSLAAGSKSHHKFVAFTTVVPWSILLTPCRTGGTTTSHPPPSTSSSSAAEEGVTVSLHISTDYLSRCSTTVLSALEPDLAVYTVPLLHTEHVLVSQDVSIAPSIFSAYATSRCQVTTATLSSPLSSSLSSQQKNNNNNGPLKAVTARVLPFNAVVTATATSISISSFRAQISFNEPQNMSACRVSNILPAEPGLPHMIKLILVSGAHVDIVPPSPFDAITCSVSLMGTAVQSTTGTETQSTSSALVMQISRLVKNSVSRRPFPVLKDSVTDTDPRTDPKGAIDTDNPRGSGRGLVCWSLPRVLLESLPAIDLESTRLSKGLLHSIHALAVEQDSFGNIPFKNSLDIVIDAAIGLLERGGGSGAKAAAGTSTARNRRGGKADPVPPPPSRRRWLALITSPAKGPISDYGPIELLIYVNAIRIDPSLGSIVLDLVMCSMSDCRDRLGCRDDPLVFLNRVLFNQGQPSCVDVVLDYYELNIWKNYLPAACERVRNSWCHSEGCEYFGRDATDIPLPSVSFRTAIDDPVMRGRVMCSCCLGKELEGTDFMKHYGHLPNFTNCFFRAAFSPMFPDDFTVP